MNTKIKFLYLIFLFCLLSCVGKKQNDLKIDLQRLANSIDSLLPQARFEVTALNNKEGKKALVCKIINSGFVPANDDILESLCEKIAVLAKSSVATPSLYEKYDIRFVTRRSYIFFNNEKYTGWEFFSEELGNE